MSLKSTIKSNLLKQVAKNKIEFLNEEGSKWTI